MFGMGHWEILILFLVILLVFGAKRIPDMAQGLGKGIREFRKAMHEVQDEIDINAPPPSDSGKELNSPPPPQTVSQKTSPVPAQEDKETPQSQP